MKADGLREFRMESVDKALDELGNDPASKVKRIPSTGSSKDERSEEDDIAIRETVREVEEELGREKGFVLPFAMIVAVFAWLFRKELMELDAVKFLLSKV